MGSNERGTRPVHCALFTVGFAQLGEKLDFANGEKSKNDLWTRGVFNDPQSTGSFRIEIGALNPGIWKSAKIGLWMYRVLRGLGVRVGS